MRDIQQQQTENTPAAAAAHTHYTCIHAEIQGQRDNGHCRQQENEQIKLIKLFSTCARMCCAEVEHTKDLVTTISIS